MCIQSEQNKRGPPASADGYKHNLVLITATNNEDMLSQKLVETTDGQLLM